MQPASRLGENFLPAKVEFRMQKKRSMMFQTQKSRNLLSKSSSSVNQTELIQFNKLQDVKSALQKVGEQDPFLKRILIDVLDSDLLNTLSQRISIKTFQPGLRVTVESAYDASGKEHQPVLVVVAGQINMVCSTDKHTDSNGPVIESKPRSKLPYLKLCLARFLAKLAQVEVPPKESLLAEFEVGTDTGLLVKCYEPSKHTVVEVKKNQAVWPKDLCHLRIPSTPLNPTIAPLSSLSSKLPAISSPSLSEAPNLQSIPPPQVIFAQTHTILLSIPTADLSQVYTTMQTRNDKSLRTFLGQFALFRGFVSSSSFLQNVAHVRRVEYSFKDRLYAKDSRDSREEAGIWALSHGEVMIERQAGKYQALVASPSLVGEKFFFQSNLDETATATTSVVALFFPAKQVARILSLFPLDRTVARSNWENRNFMERISPRRGIALENQPISVPNPATKGSKPSQEDDPKPLELSYQQKQLAKMVNTTCRMNITLRNSQPNSRETSINLLPSSLDAFHRKLSSRSQSKISPYQQSSSKRNANSTYLFRMDPPKIPLQSSLVAASKPLIPQGITGKTGIRAQANFLGRSNIPDSLHKQEQKLALIRSHESSANKDVGWHTPRHSTQRKLIADFSRARFLASTALRVKANAQPKRDSVTETQKDSSVFLATSRLYSARASLPGSAKMKGAGGSSVQSIQQHTLVSRRVLSPKYQSSSSLSRKGVHMFHPLALNTLQLDLT